jgi:hypothetical protein
MKPVQRAHKAGEEQGKRITARDVRELVSQHDATMRLRPIECVFRQEDYGIA